MLKQTLKFLIQTILLIIWGVLLFFQRIASFDVFSTNAWYLYLIVILFAMMQFFIIFIQYKMKVHKVYLSLCKILYIIAACWSLFVLLLICGSDIGLPLVCLVFDLCGIYITHKGTTNTGDGSAC